MRAGVVLWLDRWSLVFGVGHGCVLFVLKKWRAYRRFGGYVQEF